MELKHSHATLLCSSIPIPSIARCYSTSHTLGTKSTKMFSVVESCQGVLRIGIGKMVKQKTLAKMEG